MEQHDNRNKRAQNTYQKQQGDTNNDQNGSSDNQLTQTQSNTRSDHEP
jgi:hypothetical protein